MLLDTHCHVGKWLYMFSVKNFSFHSTLDRSSKSYEGQNRESFWPLGRFKLPDRSDMQLRYSVNILELAGSNGCQGWRNTAKLTFSKQVSDQCDLINTFHE
ncbi:hypothetical protein SUGI_0345210 [Cryptomeria japonica]|nr:hypothetical protein SUGI_0345210 [Cryptomeria japonica]